MIYIKRLLQSVLWAWLLVVLWILLINVYVIHAGSKRMQGIYAQYSTIVDTTHSINQWNFPTPYIWVVLWASVSSTGNLSPILKQRVDKIFELYIQGMISKILVSAYDKDANYLEATSMRVYLMSLWVPNTDILVDHKWYDTLASIQHLEDYPIDKYIIVSQQYHLYRALYYTNFESDDVLYIWIPADYNPTFAQKYTNSREILARVKAFGEMMFLSRGIDIAKCWTQQSLECLYNDLDTARSSDDYTVDTLKKYLFLVLVPPFRAWI